LVVVRKEKEHQPRSGKFMTRERWDTHHRTWKACVGQGHTLLTTNDDNLQDLAHGRIKGKSTKTRDHVSNSLSSLLQETHCLVGCSWVVDNKKKNRDSTRKIYENDWKITFFFATSTVLVGTDLPFFCEVAILWERSLKVFDRFILQKVQVQSWRRCDVNGWWRMSKTPWHRFDFYERLMLPVYIMFFLVMERTTEQVTKIFVRFHLGNTVHLAQMYRRGSHGCLESTSIFKWEQLWQFADSKKLLWVQYYDWIMVIDMLSWRLVHSIASSRILIILIWRTWISSILTTWISSSWKTFDSDASSSSFVVSPFEAFAFSVFYFLVSRRLLVFELEHRSERLCQPLWWGSDHHHLVPLVEQQKRVHPKVS